MTPAWRSARPKLEVPRSCRVLGDVGGSCPGEKRPSLLPCGWPKVEAIGRLLLHFLHPLHAQRLRPKRKKATRQTIYTFKQKGWERARYKKYMGKRWVRMLYGSEVPSAISPHRGARHCLSCLLRSTLPSPLPSGSPGNRPRSPASSAIAPGGAGDERTRPAKDGKGHHRRGQQLHKLTWGQLLCAFLLTSIRA